MSRLIDADVLKPEFVHGRWDARYVAEKDILNAPTVDAVPVVHGNWVLNENDDMFYCTNCKSGSVRNDYPYCHWCGAKMDREKVTE